MAETTTSFNANDETSTTATDETTSTTSLDGSEPATVVEAVWGAWAHDVDGFLTLVADDATWFGQGLDTDFGRASFENAVYRATAIGARFTDFTCLDTGEVDPGTQGVIVRCVGFYSDGRFEAFETPPQPATGEYAVRDGQVVNAISYESAPPPWVVFSIDYLGKTYPDEMLANCDGPDATGETCGSFQLENSAEAAAAWLTQEGETGS